MCEGLSFVRPDMRKGLLSRDWNGRLRQFDCVELDPGGSVAWCCFFGVCLFHTRNKGRVQPAGVGCCICILKGRKRKYVKAETLSAGKKTGRKGRVALLNWMARPNPDKGTWYVMMGVQLKLSSSSTIFGLNIGSFYSSLLFHKAMRKRVNRVGSYFKMEIAIGSNRIVWWTYANLRKLTKKWGEVMSELSHNFAESTHDKREKLVESTTICIHCWTHSFTFLSSLSEDRVICNDSRCSCRNWPKWEGCELNRENRCIYKVEVVTQH